MSHSPSSSSSSESPSETFIDTHDYSAATIPDDTRTIMDAFVLKYHNLLQSKGTVQCGELFDYPCRDTTGWGAEKYLKVLKNFLDLCKYMQRRSDKVVWRQRRVMGEELDTYFRQDLKEDPRLKADHDGRVFMMRGSVEWLNVVFEW